MSSGNTAPNTSIIYTYKATIVCVECRNGQKKSTSELKTKRQYILSLQDYAANLNN